MKKYLIAVLLLFIPCVTYALTMCARDNSLVVALNPSVVGGATSAINRNEYIWRVNFTYGTIIGEATCLSETEKENVSLSDYPKGLHGKDERSENRLYCYCRMTHPALSAWVHVISYSSAEECINCTGFCAQTAAGSRISINTRLFNSIGK